MRRMQLFGLVLFFSFIPCACLSSLCFRSCTHWNTSGQCSFMSVRECVSEWVTKWNDIAHNMTYMLWHALTDNRVKCMCSFVLSLSFFLFLSNLFRTIEIEQNHHWHSHTGIKWERAGARVASTLERRLPKTFKCRKQCGANKTSIWPFCSISNRIITKHSSLFSLAYKLTIQNCGTTAHKQHVPMHNDTHRKQCSHTNIHAHIHMVYRWWWWQRRHFAMQISKKKAIPMEFLLYAAALSQSKWQSPKDKILFWWHENRFEWDTFIIAFANGTPPISFCWSHGFKPPRRRMAD